MWTLARLESRIVFASVSFRGLPRLPWTIQRRFSDQGLGCLRWAAVTDNPASIVVFVPKIPVIRQRFHADVSVDFPVLRENSGVQFVPGWRFQTLAGFRFQQIFR